MHGRTDARTEGWTENIYSIFRDKLLLLGEHVFCLIGGNLNSALSREVRERKISNIHRILKTWDIQGGGFSKIGIDWRKLHKQNKQRVWRPDSGRATRSIGRQRPTIRAKMFQPQCRQQGGIAIFAKKELQQ